VLLDRSGAAGSGSARGEVASWDDRLFATSLLDLSCCEFITGKFIPRRGWQLQRYNDGKLQKKKLRESKLSKKNKSSWAVVKRPQLRSRVD
jgi:hypothetical protein